LLYPENIFGRLKFSRRRNVLVAVATLAFLKHPLKDALRLFHNESSAWLLIQIHALTHRSSLEEQCIVRNGSESRMFRKQIAVTQAARMCILLRVVHFPRERERGNERGCAQVCIAHRMNVCLLSENNTADWETS